MFKKRRRRRPAEAAEREADAAAAEENLHAEPLGAHAAADHPGEGATTGARAAGDEEDDDADGATLAVAGRIQRRRKIGRRGEHADADSAKTVVRPDRPLAAEGERTHDLGDRFVASDDAKVDLGRERIPTTTATAAASDEHADLEDDEDAEAWEASVLRRAGARQDPAKPAADKAAVAGSTAGSVIPRRDIFASLHRLAQNARETSETARYRVTKREEELADLRAELEQHKAQLTLACDKHDRRQTWRKFLEGIRGCLREKSPMVAQVRARTGKLRRQRLRARTEARHQAVADALAQHGQSQLADNCGPAFPQALIAGAAAPERAVDELGRDISARRDSEVRQRVESALVRWKSATSLLEDEQDPGECKARALRASQVLQGRALIFADVAPPFDTPSWLAEVARWSAEDAADFDEAEVRLALPELVAPYLHAQLVLWDPHAAPAPVEPTTWAEAGPAFAWANQVAVVEGLLADCISRDLIPTLCTTMRREWDICDAAASKRILHVCKLSSSAVQESATREKAARALARAAGLALSRAMDALGVPLLDNDALRDANGFARQSCTRQLELIVGASRSARVWQASTSPLRADSESLRAVRSSVRAMEERALKCIEMHERDFGDWPALAAARRAIDEADDDDSM